MLDTFKIRIHRLLVKTKAPAFVNPYTHATTDNYRDPFKFRQPLQKLQKEGPAPVSEPSFFKSCVETVFMDVSGAKEHTIGKVVQMKANAEAKARFEDLAYGRR